MHFTAVLSTDIQEKSDTIIVVPKPIYRARTPSSWIESSKDMDDDKYDYVFKQNLGYALRKPKEDTSKVHESTIYKFDETKDKADLDKNLVFEKDATDAWKKVVRHLVIEFWDIFREDGVTTPVKDYKLVIDTRDHQPIAVEKPHYGINE
eukprot:2459627-Ditylum_brightwellii.AAC.1